MNKLNFVKKNQGVRPATATNSQDDTDCVSKVAEIFDITSKMVSTAALKIDLHDWLSDTYNEMMSFLIVSEQFGNATFK